MTPRSIKVFVYTLITLVLFLPDIYSQENYFSQQIEAPYNEYSLSVLEDDQTSIAYSIGFSFSLGKKKNNSLSAYVAVSAVHKIFTHKKLGMLVAGQSKLVFYRGGLGTSFFNHKNFKINIDSRNTLTISTGYGKNTRWIGKPMFVEVDMNVSSLYDLYDYSLGLGTTFINGINHSRNQQIGSLSLSGGPVTFQYYNDGTPFGILGTGDLFDRYWTGGGSLGYYSRKDDNVFNEFILRYDNYTGYQPNLFNVAGLLDINHMPYKNEKEQFFNQARYKYSLGLYSNNRFNISVWEPVYTDVQNFIHYNISNDPFHARPFKRRVTMGYDYINFNLVK